MPGYNVHEALYQNCKILDPFVRCSGSRVGPIWPYIKTVLNPKNLLLFSHTCGQKTEYMVMMSTNSST